MRAPVGVDEADVRRNLLADCGIEVGAGLGPLKGKMWLVGLVGETSRRRNVRALIEALGEALDESGFNTDTEQALEAAADQA